MRVSWGRPGGDMETGDAMKRPTQRVVLVRHAQTAWSLTGQHTGTTDLPLTEEGRALTAPLSRRLAKRRFDRVWSSPLRRAEETCRIAGFAGQAELRDELVEWDYGAYEGRTTAQIRAERPGWDLWRDGAPGGESPADVSGRLDRLVAELLETCEHGEDTLVFGHGHSLSGLTVRWLGLPITRGHHFRLGTGSVSVLGWKREVQVLELWNDRGHLPGEP